MGIQATQPFSRDGDSDSTGIGSVLRYQEYLSQSPVFDKPTSTESRSSFTHPPPSVMTVTDLGSLLMSIIIIFIINEG